MAKVLKPIQNSRRSLSKNKEWNLIVRIFSSVALLFCFSLSFAEKLTSDKTIITGDEMEIRRSGDVTVSRGNSKAVNGRNTVEAKKMTYDKNNGTVEAAGNVKLFSSTDDGEPLKAFGDFASYNIRSSRGKLWGEKTFVEYFMKDSKDPLMLNAKEIELDRNIETLSAYKSVEIMTTSGTITSDNAVFDRKTYSVLMLKDEKRPIADVYYDGRNGLYEADKMIFYNSDANKKIVMSGQVTGKIEMEDGVGEKDKPEDKKKKAKDKGGIKNKRK